MPEVKCAVANCTYWNEGNKCGADAIMIETDKRANADVYSEFAEEYLDTSHEDAAPNVRSTCCHTFKSK
ncbi:MAG: putative transporter, permease protein [Paenibacillaceae bacterium]|jgi:hypothetical protein|nr:putative transporter, permease protein [Paenibacillaceae bacterium]